MRSRALLTGFVLIILGSGTSKASAATLGSITGTIRDPNGQPLPHAVVQLHDEGSDYRAQTTSNDRGEYALGGLAPATYRLTAALQNFKTIETTVSVPVGGRVVVDLALQLGGISETVTVTGKPSEDIVPGTSRTLISQGDLDRIPGAVQSGSFAALVETTPSAVVAHDQVHIRGGHQVAYQIDGVPVPSNSVGANFALLFDLKDVKVLEVQRGAYSAAYGDRLYGLFNVVTRSGFDHARGGEALFLAGQQRTLEGAVAYGDHAGKVAYFAQASASRTDFGLTPPAPEARHDRHWGAGGAAKLWVLAGSADMVTVTGSLRADRYQIPRAAPVLAIDDNTQLERDAFVNSLWLHTASSRTGWSIAPYYHFNRVALNPEATQAFNLSQDNRRIHYLGAKADWTYSRGPHLFKAGTNLYGSFLRDAFLFAATADRFGFADSVVKAGSTQALYLEAQYQPTNALTLDAGVRWDRSSAYLTESMVGPRLGVVAHLPGTPLSGHVYFGRFFQVPPLEALGVGGARFAASGDQAFLLVRAERNTSWEAGASVATRGVLVDVTYYQNLARHFLDHEQLGNSSVFLPVNIARARLRGLEVSASSPRGKALRARLVYAHGYAEARGAVTGGLGDIEPRAGQRYFFLDHDQRHTAVASLEYAPSQRGWAHLSLLYGSGFLREQGPDHLPLHVTANASAGITLGHAWSAAVELENLTDRRYLVNLSSEFNGTHYARGRYVSGRVRFRF